MRFGIGLASWFNHKACLWADGRRDIFNRLSMAVSGSENIVWMHCASLGEFEQGRPLLEAIRREQPERKILLTFFSPSGYEVRKNYEGVDWVFYLPADTKANARQFVNIVRPEVAIFIKYEYWLNHLAQMERFGTKIYIVSAIFRPDDVFFRFYGGIFRKALGRFTKLFVQNQQSVDLLRSIGVDSVVAAGDTRFDRVAEIAAAQAKVDIAERFVKSADWVFVAGSTWPKDEEIVGELLRKWSGVKFIIAPHQIDNPRIDAFMAQVGGGAVRYTECTDVTDLSQAQVLMVDTIGVLSKLYRYGNVAYIGGGFGVGIHNTLEAATFGLPIAFGPNYGKFKEAKDMVELGAARSVEDMAQLNEWFSQLYNDRVLYASVCKTTQDYVKSNIGATKMIMNSIFSK